MMCIVGRSIYGLTFKLRTMKFEDNILYFITEWNLSFVLIACILTCLWMRSRRPMDLPAGPKPMFIFGNMLTLVGRDILQTTKQLSKKYGSLFSLSLGPYWVIFVNDSHTLQEIFVKHADKFSDRPDMFIFKQVLGGKGLGASNGKSWKLQRTFAINALKHFGFGKRSMESKIMAEIGYFIDVLDSKKSCSISIETLTKQAISNIISSIVFGQRFNYDDPVCMALITKISENLGNPYLNLVNWIPWLHNISKIYDVFGTQRAINNVKCQKTEIRKIIDEHRSSLDENDPRDFVDAYLMEWKRHSEDTDTIFTEDNLESVALDVFGASIDSTSSTILWIVLFLVNNPDVQSQLRKELIDVVGRDREASLGDKQNMPYCRAVIYETQRLGNVAPLSLPHTTTEDVVINGCRIPKGSIIMANLNAAMHDENIFPNSSKFDPSRFLDVGRRVCPGESLANMEIFLFLTSIIRRYRIVPEEGERPLTIKGTVGLVHSPLPYKVRFVDW